MDYVHTVRIEEAKQILETTDFNVETIGEEVGYEDPASFRRLFKRKSGLTPAEYRRLFGRRRFERYQSVRETADWPSARLHDGAKRPSFSGPS